MQHGFNASMRRHLGPLGLAALLCLGAAASVMPLPAFADGPAAVPAPNVARLKNIRQLGSVVPTAGSTFNATSLADLPNSTITFTPMVDYATTGAPGEPNPVAHLHIIFNADAIKATSTTGACELYVNGGAVAATLRSLDTAAVHGTMTIYADIAESTSGSQIIKVQCKSGDTAVFTITNAILEAEEVY